MPVTHSHIALPHNGQAIDCYLAAPEGGGRVPAVVMASSVFGVGEDLIELCHVFANAGCLVAAPDLFWAGDKGPLPRTDEGQKRAMARVADRPHALEQASDAIRAALARVRSDARCNGRTAILGFCFGGPFAVAGLADMGCDAGGSFHGSEFEDQLDNLAKVDGPLELHWGDADFALPPELLDRVRSACRHNTNCNIVIYPGIRHGYTGRSSPAFDPAATENSVALTLKMLDRLRT